MKTIKEMKADQIRKALKKHKNNRTHAAKAIGMSIRSLRLWIANEPRLKDIHNQKIKGDGITGKNKGKKYKLRNLPVGQIKEE